MWNFYRKPFFVVYIMLFLSLSFFGCRQEEGGSTGSTGESSSVPVTSAEPGKQVSFAYALPSWIQSGTSSQEKFTADDILTGSLTVEDINDASNNQTFNNWTIYLSRDGDGVFTAQSNQTINLVPGDYQFSLLVSTSDGRYEYTTGSVFQEISLQDEEEANVSLTIHPVIGGSIVDASVADRIFDLEFNYEISDLANFVSPWIKVFIDSDPTGVDLPLMFRSM